MKKRTAFLVSALGFLIGIICGFLISPVKNGMGNNSTMNFYAGKEVNLDKKENDL